MEQVPHQQAHEVARRRAGKRGIDPAAVLDPLAATAWGAWRGSGRAGDAVHGARRWPSKEAATEGEAGGGSAVRRRWQLGAGRLRAGGRASMAQDLHARRPEAAAREAAGGARLRRVALGRR